MSIIICVGKISRYLKVKYNREFGKGIIKLQSSIIRLPFLQLHSIPFLQKPEVWVMYLL